MRRATKFRLRIASFRTDRSATAAVEFAVIVPVMLLIYLGGYQISQGVSAYRKTAITARTLVDLATQYQTISGTNMSDILNASAQIMAPFPKPGLSIVLTQFSVSSQGVATVAWSKALNGTALVAGQQVTLPAGVCQNGASVVRSDVKYTYTPAVAYSLIGSLPMTASLYMSPRQIQSISYTGS